MDIGAGVDPIDDARFGLGHRIAVCAKVRQCCAVMDLERRRPKGEALIAAVADLLASEGCALAYARFGPHIAVADRDSRPERAP